MTEPAEECVRCSTTIEESTLPLLCDSCLRESAQEAADRLDVLGQGNARTERRTRA